MNHARRLAVTIIALIAVPQLAVADDAAKAKEILEESRNAIKQAKTVSYTAKYTADGWVKTQVPEVNGKVTLGPSGEYDDPRFISEVSIKKPDWEEGKSFTAGCDGDEYFLVDAGTKKVHHDIDPVVLGSNARDIQRVNMPELTSDDPFKDLLAAKSYAVKETTVDGVLCYEITAEMEGRQEKAQVWWFSKRDHLPRGVRRVYAPRGDEGDEDGATQLMISNVTAKADFAPAAFKLKVPAGYTKTDEFAP